MAKLIFTFFCFLSFLIASEPIKIVYNSGNPPLKFTDSNNKAAGLLIDIWRLWAKKNNIKIEFIDTSWDESLKMIENKKADIHAGIYYTKKRDKFLDYTSHVLYDNYKYFFYYKNLPNINEMEDLKPYVIGIDNGFPNSFMQRTYPEYKINAYSNANESNEAFFKGKQKVVLSSLATFFYYLKKEGLNEEDFLYDEFTYAYSKKYYGAVRQGNKKLLKLIDEGFNKITKDELDLLTLQWTKELDVKKVNLPKKEKNLNDSQLLYLNKKQKIVMCVDPFWLPFEKIENNKHIGMIADIYKLFEKKLQHPIELKVTNSWSETLEYAESKKCDIISAAAKTSNRQKYLNFTEPYLKFPEVIVTREKEPFIVDFRKVIKRKIGIVKNSAIAELLKNKYPNINLIDVENVNDGLFKVSSGELFGFVNTTASLSYAIAKNGMTNLKIAAKTGINYYLRIAIRNDEPVLLDIFNKIILQIDKKDIENIKDKWLTVKVEEVVDYTLLYEFIIIFILIVFIVLYWNRKLQVEIDERKIAQGELNKFMQVIEQSQVSIMITNSKGIIEYVNPYSELETGYTLKELVGENPSILKSGHQNEQFYNQLWETILSGKTWFGEFSNRKKTGEYFWESAIIAPVFDENKEIKYFASIKEDITEEKRIKKELEFAQKEAESANRAKSDFLAKMSHEIRTPMNAVLGMLYLLEKTPLKTVQEDYIKKAKSAASSLLGVINDILDFSKIEADKLEIKNEEFNLHEMIDEIMSVMSIKAEENHLELLSYYDRNFPTYVVSDSLRLSQILNNLLSNAIKFTNNGEVLISTKLVSKKKDKAILMFCVKDSGIGISKENQQKLFKEFSQVDDSATRSFHGTGLGLAICKKLSLLLGGEIWIEDSQENIGTTICFTIEVKIIKEHMVDKFKFPENINKLKVLVVDDNKVATKVLCDILNSFNYVVESTNNGIDAIKLIEKNTYDIVFLDYKMPGLNGIDTFKQYKQKLKDKTPRTILITAFSQELLEKDLEKEGILGYLTKPISPSSLYDCIIDSLNIKKVVKSKPINKLKTEEQKLKAVKVLLVEDNKLNQEFAISMLEAFGLEVDIANDGYEAIEKIKSKIYTIVLMDIQMPNLDGYEATKLIRNFEDRYYKTIPIIALSANALLGDKEKSLNIGMNEHLTKPINPDELYNTLKSYINDIKDIDDADVSSSLDELDNEVLNTSEAMKRMANNEKAYLKVLTQFYLNYNNVFEEIDKLIAKNNIKELADKIHELKGITGNIAAKKLFEILEDLNIILVEKKMPPYDLFKECKKSLKEVLLQIKEIQKESKIESKEFDKDIVFSLLFDIKSNLNMDIVKCEDSLDELIPYLQEKYPKTLNNIIDALNEFDLDKVDKQIDNFLRELENE